MLIKWIVSLFCQSFSSKLKGARRLKGESQKAYYARRKGENKLTKAYIRGEIYKKGRNE